MSQGRGAAESAVAAWVGLDWSEGTHEVCLQVDGSTKVQRMEVGGEAEQIQAWLGELRQRFGGRKVAICLEKFRGGLLYALMACEFVLLYAVNPQLMAKYRKVFKVSGAKDDPLDATLLLDLLRKYRERLQVLEPGDEASRGLYLLCEGRRRLVDERTRLGQQVRSLLKSYYPQALRWAGSLDQRWAGKFLKRWPSLQKLQQARAQSREGWYARESGRPRQWRRHLEQIAQAQALTDDEAVVSTSVLRLQALVGQIQELSKAIKTYDQQIAKQWAAHVDREQFDSFPGAGPVLAPPSERGLRKPTATV